jgi:cob(I)alamin adenosyltransferase
MSGDNAYKERMRRKKAVVDAHVAQADTDKGLLLVLTGNGKGKSSSGFGMVARALGHGMKVGVVQFIKGAATTGEENFFRRFPDEVVYHVTGEGFTWETQDKERDRQVAEQGWQKAAALLADPEIGLVLLDELNIVLKYGYLELDKVLADIRQRPPMQHVVVTGRGAPAELVAVADTVTELSVVKHAFQAGVRAQKGVEF